MWDSVTGVCIGQTNIVKRLYRLAHAITFPVNQRWAPGSTGGRSRYFLSLWRAWSIIVTIVESACPLSPKSRMIVIALNVDDPRLWNLLVHCRQKAGWLWLRWMWMTTPTPTPPPPPPLLPLHVTASLIISKKRPWVSIYLVTLSRRCNGHKKTGSLIRKGSEPRARFLEARLA